jgi:hypothetical protein
MTLPTTEKVLAYLREPETAYFEYARDWFSPTWLESYVRLVTLLPVKPVPTELLLAQVLCNDPTHPDWKPAEWLPNCAFEQISERDIRSLLEQAQADLTEGKSDSATALIVEDTLPLAEIRLDPLSSAAQISGLGYPCTKRMYGPTYQMVWRSENWFYYLEVHNES